MCKLDNARKAVVLRLRLADENSSHNLFSMSAFIRMQITQNFGWRIYRYNPFIPAERFIKP